MEGELSDLHIFVHRASPAEWADYGSDLASAVPVLYEAGAAGISLRSGPGKQAVRNTPHSRTALLLAAFALENVIKGHLVAADPLHVNTGELSRALKQHDLVRLLEGLPAQRFTQAEREVLRMASDALPYWGRYPIPLKAENVTHERVFDEPAARTFWRLFWRLHDELIARVRAGWDSGVGVVARVDDYFRAPHEWDAPET